MAAARWGGREADTALIARRWPRMLRAATTGPGQLLSRLTISLHRDYATRTVEEQAGAINVHASRRTCRSRANILTLERSHHGAPKRHHASVELTREP